MKYIVSVLDYFSNTVDIFSVNIPKEENMDEWVMGYIENRGHSIEDCHYMCSKPNNFKMTMKII